MVKITFKVEGLRALNARFNRLTKKMQTSTGGRCTGAGARVVKAAAKRNIRAQKSVDTELLEGAVIMKRFPKAQTALTSEHMVTIKKKVYSENNPKGDRNTRRSGVFIEYGTVNLDPKPYLRRALARGRKQAQDAMIDALRKELDKGGA